MATDIVKTLKAAGGDFTSINAWVAWCYATYPSLVTADVRLILECYKGDYTAAGGGVNYISEAASLRNSYTTAAFDSTRYMLVTVPVTERHTGRLKIDGIYTGFAVEPTGSCYGSHLCVFDGLIINFKRANDRSIILNSYNSHRAGTFKNGYVVSSQYRAFLGGDYAAAYIYGNVIIGPSYGSTYPTIAQPVNNTGAPLCVYHNTIIGADVAWQQIKYGTYVYNNIIFGVTNTINTKDYNVTGDTTRSEHEIGIDSIDDLGLVSVALISGTNYEAFDLRLASGSVAVGAAVDPFTLGTPGWGSRPIDSTDALGTARPQGTTWDIGAFELVVAGGSVYETALTLAGSTGVSPGASADYSAAVEFSAAGGVSDAGAADYAAAWNAAAAAALVPGGAAVLLAGLALTGSGTMATSGSAEFAAGLTLPANTDLVPSYGSIVAAALALEAVGAMTPELQADYQATITALAQTGLTATAAAELSATWQAAVVAALIASTSGAEIDAALNLPCAAALTVTSHAELAAVLSLETGTAIDGAALQTAFAGLDLVVLAALAATHPDDVAAVLRVLVLFRGASPGISFSGKSPTVTIQ
jgi:hypothetical protein